MDTKEIAQKLVEYCRAGEDEKCLNELYADDAVSTEPMAPEGQDPVTRGLDGIRGKHDWWNSNFEVHDFAVEGPFLNGDNFTTVFEIDATDKSSGERWKAREIGLYEVEDGKIARETFFMAPMT